MAAKSKIITIRLDAGTADLIYKMNEAGAKVSDFGNKGTAALQRFGQQGSTALAELGTHGVSNVQATSAALRTLEFNTTNNIRASEQFIANYLGLGPIIQKAFPLIGLFAFGELLAGIGTRAYQFFKDIEEAPLKASSAFRTLGNSTQLTNDQLSLSNAKLENEIAKLQGHRQNNLKIMFEEANVAADKLAGNVEKLIGDLQTIAKEQVLGGFKAFITSQKSTSGEEEGLARFKNQLADTMRAGNEEIRGAGTDEGRRGAAEAKRNAALKQNFDDEIARRETDIVRAEVEQDKNDRIRKTLLVPKGSSTPLLTDQSRFIRERKLALEEVLRAFDQVQLLTDEGALKGKESKLKSGIHDEKPGELISARVQAMKDQLGEIQAKLAAVGQTDAFKAQTEGAAEAVKKIDELNKVLVKYHTRVDPATQIDIQDLAVRSKQIENETAWQTKLQSSSVALNERIAAQQRLTAAIGQGYEAVRKANVENQIAAFIGDHAGDAGFLAEHAGEIEERRARLTKAFDVDHKKQIDETVDKLNDQIELEQKLATVQRDGAEAVRLATLALRIARIEKDNSAESAKKLVQAEIAFSEAQKANLSATTLAALNEKLTLTQKITAAQLQGAEAVRQAGLEEKYTQLAKSVSPEVVQATRNVDSAEHQGKITAEALKTGIAYRNQLEAIDQQIAALKEIAITEENRVVIAQSLFNLEQERLRVLVQQQLALRTASAGVRAFFIEMQEAGKSTAQVIYDALNQSVDRLSENLSKLATGQKAAWAQAFKDIGAEIQQTALKQLLQKGIGAIGSHLPGDLADKLGIKKPLKRYDGQSQPTAWWVQIANQQAANGGSTAPPGASAPGVSHGPNLGPLFSGASQLSPFIFNLLGNLGGKGGGSTESVSSSIDFGGGFADGGDVDPGHSYIVGERGPEAFRPKSAGSIIPNHQLGGSVTNHNYSIDARATDPVMVEAAVRRGSLAAHNTAVANSARLADERAKRVPR